jgi:hypothetical protein
MKNGTTQPEKFKCTEPGCHAEYNDAAHLGIHRRAKHGILGKSANALKRRQLKTTAKSRRWQTDETQPTNPPIKRKYTKRSELATIPNEKANGHVNHTGNGQAQAISHRIRAEAALAIAFGRFKELCAGVAYEYDLAPRTFAARLVELIHSSSETLR